MVEEPEFVVFDFESTECSELVEVAEVMSGSPKNCKVPIE